MYNGATRKLALQKNVICEDCNGLGGPEGAVQRCTNCRGSGMQVRLQQLGPGIMQQVQSVCRECQGQGERIDPKLRCKGCSGKKVGAIHNSTLNGNLEVLDNDLTFFCPLSILLRNHVTFPCHS